MDALRIQCQFEVSWQLITELKVYIVLLLLQVLQEPVLTLAEIDVTFDRPCQAVAHEAKIDEARSHCNLLRTKRVAVITGLKLLLLVKQWRPDVFDFFPVDVGLSRN